MFVDLVILKAKKVAEVSPPAVIIILSFTLEDYQTETSTEKCIRPKKKRFVNCVPKNQFMWHQVLLSNTTNNKNYTHCCGFLKLWKLYQEINVHATQECFIRIEKRQYFVQYDANRTLN